MVNVAHDGYHRSARQRLKLGLRHVIVGKCFWIVQRSDHRLVAQLFHQNHGGVLVQRLVDGDHLAELHQLLDHLRGLHRHLVGEFRHRDGFRHVHFQHARFHRCGLHVVVAVAVIATAATGAGAPVGRATCARTRVATGFEFFLLGRVARPAAGELGRLDLFASACTSRTCTGTRRFCHGRTGSRLVQSTFDCALGVNGRLGWFGLFQGHGHFIGRGHHQANGSGFGLGLAAAITQFGCALGFFSGSGFGCAGGGGQGFFARLGRGLGSDLCAVSGLGLRSVYRSGGRCGGRLLCNLGCALRLFGLLRQGVGCGFFMRCAGFGFLVFAFLAARCEFFFLAADELSLVTGLFFAAHQLSCVNHMGRGNWLGSWHFGAFWHGVHAVFAADKGALFAHFHLDRAGLATGVSLLDLGGLLLDQGDFLAVSAGRAVAALQEIEQTVLVSVSQNVAGRRLGHPGGL